MTEFHIAHVPFEAVPDWEASGWVVCGDFEGTHHDKYESVLMRKDRAEGLQMKGLRGTVHETVVARGSGQPRRQG